MNQDRLSLLIAFCSTIPQHLFCPMYPQTRDKKFIQTSEYVSSVQQLEESGLCANFVMHLAMSDLWKEQGGVLSPSFDLRINNISGIGALATWLECDWKFAWGLTSGQLETDHKGVLRSAFYDKKLANVKLRDIERKLKSKLVEKVHVESIAGVSGETSST